MTRKLWACDDGNGGYDIGEFDFTLAGVRNIKFQDGYRVAKAYEAKAGAEFNPRELALMFKAAPDMLAALERLLPIAERAFGALTTDLDPARDAIAKARGVKS